MLLPTLGDAHKPITSPFTFNEDVLPIVRDRCAGCHYPGGVAPMSLLTHADAVPWGESMRAELMAGHMPPWRIDSAAERFRNVRPLTGRELNVLLTWASGGTPAGDPANAHTPLADEHRWPLGAPDLVLPMPSGATLAADVQEQVTEFVVRPPADRRFIRAADLLPGTPSIVRSATVFVRPPAAVSGSGAAAERLIALWLPGDHPVPLEAGAGFDLPAGSELVVRIRYRKTWEYENRVMSDRSNLGLYFAEDSAAPVRAFALSGVAGAGTSSTTVREPLRAVAIYPDADLADASITVVAIRPDKSRESLIAFRPRRGWARRYWFREPIALPRGTRIEVQSRTGAPLLPPGALPAKAPAPSDKIHLTLNVIPGL